MGARASVLGLLIVGLLASTAAGAHAQVVQPSGLTIPLDSANGETQLYTFFASRGEAIDYVADARRTPDTFSPLCDFTASLVLNEAGLRYGVGWYNADPTDPTPPTTGEIYEIVPAGSPLGTTITGASIRGDSRYAGGLIGFALLRSPPHFTEARYNTVCDSGPCAATPGPWVLSLSYLSTVTPNAWYVAFEDGDTSSSSWNNDGDYNDDVFYFTGITCAGGGEPCAVPAGVGVCADGLTECGTGGELTCRPVVPSSDERCDGLDSDCDGAVDEGEGLCPGLEVCDRGVCVAPCFEGGCGVDEVCLEGVCVDRGCESLTCPAGQRCVAGACVLPCDGIVCPGEQVCRAGRCTDPCAGVTCEAGRVCEGGVCVEACDCRACAAGRACATDGRCVPEGCEEVGCGPGTTCRAGSCVDACDGAVCPAGQACEGGACVDRPTTGSDAGPPGDAGTGSDAGPLPDAGGGGDASMGGDAGGDAGGRPPVGDGDSGCGCRVPGGDAGDRGAPAGLAGLLLLGVLARRRRR